MKDDFGQNFDLKEEIRSYWSGRAEKFDESASHRIEDKYGLPVWQAFLRRSFGLKQDQTLAGKKVLDIACGTGEISRMLCSLDAEVTGLDFSEVMHAKAKQKLKGKSWRPLSCDAENLVGVPDDSFDFAITRHLAWTLTEPTQAYAEWFRVLKPGGRLLIVDGDWSRKTSLMQQIRRRIAEFLLPLPERSGEEIAKDQKIRERLPYRGGLTQEQLKRELLDAGFDPVQVASVSKLYGRGMRAWPFATRLRQTSAHRFALICTVP